jgi:hypothetical protein
VFEVSYELRGFAAADIEGEQIAPVVEMDQAATEDNAIAVEKTTPKIGQVIGIEWLAGREAERFQGCV